MTKADELSAHLARLTNALVRFDTLDVSVDIDKIREKVMIVPAGESRVEVSIEFDGEEYIVSTDFWNGHFYAAQDAMDLCIRILTPEMRQKEVKRGNSTSSVHLQSRGKGGCEDGPRTWYIFVPFWKPKQVYFCQNDALSEAEADAVMTEVFSGNLQGLTPQ